MEIKQHSLDQLMGQRRNQKGNKKRFQNKSRAIKQEIKKIKGVKIHKKEVKPSLFSDDIIYIYVYIILKILPKNS